MRKFFLVNLGVVALSCMVVLLPSCKKKIVHETHPTPDNNRIHSYTKFTNPLVGTPTNETFRFYYDGNNRVIEIAYTANMPSGINQKRMLFSYVNDTIFKTTIEVQQALVIQRDTFIRNSNWQITKAYFPDAQHEFFYSGKLLVRESTAAVGKGGVIAGGTRYTSNNGDLLNRSFDGTLTVHFRDSGLSSLTLPPDTVLTPAMRSITWTDLVTSTVTEHKDKYSYTDQLTGYTSGSPVSVQATDTNGIVSYPLVWPGGVWGREEYKVYPDLDNRPGDYWQIESFTTYGINVYRNDHLLRNVYGTGGLVPGYLNVEYTIDADSKITQTYVTGYGYINASSIVYKFQWETH